MKPVNAHKRLRTVLGTKQMCNKYYSSLLLPLRHIREELTRVGRDALGKEDSTSGMSVLHELI